MFLLDISSFALVGQQQINHQCRGYWLLIQENTSVNKNPVMSGLEKSPDYP